MKVEIIARGGMDNHRILTRLAKILSAGLGWPIKPLPTESTEIAYYFPYLEYEPHTGAKAGWFTHRDDGRDGKVAMWQTMADTVGLRTTSARMYLDGLSQHGISRLITPPLDRQKFRPGVRRQRANPPIVGTTGYCYPGGRKGEALLSELTRRKIAKGIDLRAAGRGWPIRTVQWPWEKLQEFYWILDVYLCTSLIEGVGYGPLEAMACGVPVVIPRAVGVFDELADVPGVYRYKAGDYADMERALQQALDFGGDAAALRDATEHYTEEGWIGGHEEAFDRAFAPGTQRIPVERPAMREKIDTSIQARPWYGKAGLYMVAFGDPARTCAQRAIASFKTQMPGVPVALVSDRKLGCEDILLKAEEYDIGARSHKVRIYDLAPEDWEYVLYLDADTETVAPIPSLFDWLADGWELVICKNPGKFALAANMGRADNTGECAEVFRQWGTDQVMQWNGGVFAFRRCHRIQAFFAKWVEEWMRYGKRDQGALLRALWENPVKMWALGNEWNLVEAYDDPARCAGVMHYPMTARRWDGIIQGRSDSQEAWEAVRKWESKR